MQVFNFEVSNFLLQKLLNFAFWRDLMSQLHVLDAPHLMVIRSCPFFAQKKRNNFV